MRVVCFHGRREIGGEALFLSAARIFAGAANHAGFSAQVRTPGFPSPPGSPDRAVVKISRAQLTDLAIPTAYDLEIVCDPLLAVVPPMGSALKPGGILVLNTQSAMENRGLRIASVDIDAIASKHAAAPVAAHLGRGAGRLGGAGREDIDSKHHRGVPRNQGRGHAGGGRGGAGRSSLGDEKSA